MRSLNEGLGLDDLMAAARDVCAFESTSSHHRLPSASAACCFHHVDYSATTRQFKVSTPCVNDTGAAVSIFAVRVAIVGATRCCVPAAKCADIFCRTAS